MKAETTISERSQVVEAFAEHVSSGKVKFYREMGVDLVMGQREGIYFWDLDGRQFINCHSNGGVFNLGHRHPQVIEALKQAVVEVDIGNHHLISRARADLAHQLAEKTAGDLNRVVFGVSGGEAIDTAIKLARGYTERPLIISAQGGYHGHTGFALAAGDEQYAVPFKPLVPGFKRVPFGDVAALEAVLNEEVAAVLLETIPATLGIVVPPEEYFAAVRALCDQVGALLIVDEVQSGLGRCGAMWAIETFGVTPDMIVTGKGLSGGIYPLSAVIHRERLNEFWQEHPFIHVSTCGGSELGCCVAQTVLKLTADEAFLSHVIDMGERFGNGLLQLQQRYPEIIQGIRRRGLMAGLQTTFSEGGTLLARAGYEEGLFTVYANNDHAVLQLLPPLIVQAAEIDDILLRLERMIVWLKSIIS